jgi:RHS repeat-associated protein
MGSWRDEAPQQAYPCLLSFVDPQRQPTASFFEVGSAGQPDKLSPASMTFTDYYVTTDAMDSVTAILDEDGTVLERRSYDAFGEMTCLTPDGVPVEVSPTGVDVGFQGQIRDEVTGLYQMGYRWYGTTLGRWLCRDPIRLAGGTNLYKFAHNSMPNRRDVNGLYVEDGHFYTTYIVASRNTSSVKEAEEIAYYSQLPDEEDSLDAIAAARDVALMDSFYVNPFLWPFYATIEERKDRSYQIQSMLHSLHGGDGACVERRRSCLAKFLRDNKATLSNWEKGLLIHAFGDSYSHTYEDNGALKAYGKPFGHAIDSVSGPDPDTIANCPQKYIEYISCLNEALGGGMTGVSLKDLSRVMTQSSRSQDEAIALARKFAQSQYGYSNNYDPAGGSRLGPWPRLTEAQVSSLMEKVKKACDGK